MSVVTPNTFKNMSPGVCFPWEEKSKEMSEIRGNEESVKQQWMGIDALGYLFTWYWVHR